MVILDWLGAFTILFSIYLTGRKIAIGWLISCVGAIIYSIVAAANGLWGWICMEVALTVMNVYNFRKWIRGRTLKEWFIEQ